MTLADVLVRAGQTAARIMRLREGGAPRPADSPPGPAGLRRAASRPYQTDTFTT